MTFKRVDSAAYSLGIYLHGKEWINNMVGYGYYFYGYDGRLYMSDTLQGIYKSVMQFPVIR